MASNRKNMPKSIPTKNMPSSPKSVPAKKHGNKQPLKGY